MYDMTELLERFHFQAIGEANPKIKQVRAVAANTKPNPHRPFIAEGL